MDDQVPAVEKAATLAQSGPVPHFNRKGQQLGEKGLRTRAAIIAETLALLPSKPLSEVTMAAVTKRIGIDAAAFYRYFADIGEVLLAALERANDEADDLRPLLQADWPPKDVRAQALVFVDAYHELFKRHAPLLRARNSLSDAGDPRFLDSRIELARGLTEDLAKKLGSADHVAEGQVTPFGMASLLIMSVERAATLRAQEIYKTGPEWADFRLGLADMIGAAIAGGQKPSLG
jgi:AcrR family transcriptional regulator